MIPTPPESRVKRSPQRVLMAGFLLVLAGCAAQANSRHQPEPGVQEPESYAPAAGFVPTAEVAIQIAYAVLVPIYGDAQIEQQQPLTAQLDGEVWIVAGTLPRGWRGGVARIGISRRDGRISNLSHGR